jgi:hypothetical protein
MCWKTKEFGTVHFIFIIIPVIIITIIIIKIIIILKK